MSDPQSTATFLAPEPSELAPLFPGYDIEYLIATGGMGAVYRAVQRSLDRTVAIKILPHEFSADAAFCAGFEAEAKAMARLNHPNLIGVYDFGEVNGMLYIIMELVPGQSLFHSSNGLAIDPSEVIRIITGICHGLAHAHEHGIIHRDIKPSNILLDLNAQPKIGDFGLARPIEVKTQEGEEIFGTPHYTAPEVVNAPHSVDNRADIFSLGVMLHELLTGTLPANDLRSASAISHCDPRFDAIIRRATNPHPEERYSTATEIANDLHTISTTAGPKVLQTTRPGGSQALRTGKPKILTPQKSSNLPGILLLLAVLAVGAFAWKQLSGPKANSEPPSPTPTPSPSLDAVEKPPLPDEISKPAPPPIVIPEPEPTITEPEPIPEPTPKPAIAPIAPVLPKFNVTGFFERAQGIMLEKAAPMIAKHKRDLATNLTNFEGALQREIRGFNSLRDRTNAGELVSSYLSDPKNEDNRIPDEFDSDLEEFYGLTKIHQQYLERQKALDDSLLQEISQLSNTYILGLLKQIERLETENDPAAIALIQEEIQKTRSDKSHFRNLMLPDEFEITEEE